MHDCQGVLLHVSTTYSRLQEAVTLQYALGCVHKQHYQAAFPMSLLLAPLRVPLLGLFLYVCMYVSTKLTVLVLAADYINLTGWFD
jgi:hypothetical protein